MFEQELLYSIVTGAGLLGINIVLMVAIALTPLANITLWLYGGAPFAPLTGVVVFGAALTGSRALGISGLTNGTVAFAIAGIVISQVSYGLFGGAVLSIFDAGLWLTAIAITTVITLVITAVCAAIVYKTDVDFSFAGTISAILLGGGTALIGVGFFVGGGALYVVGFVAFLLGFIVRNLAC